MQVTKMLPSKCKHQDQVKGLCRRMPWNREIDFDLECLNYHNRDFFKMTKVLSVNDRAKVWEIKKVAERFVISHQHKKLRL